LTWTIIADTGAQNSRLVVYSASGSSTVGTLSLNLADAGYLQISWMVVAWTGTDITTGDGIVQGVAGTTTADSITVTLDAFADAANGTCAFYSSLDTSLAVPALSPGTGFTELVEIQPANYGSLAFEYRTDNDTSVDATAETINDRMCMVAMEIAAA
jgi:hypothetical protein